jgi:hypothetical protein
MFRKKRDDTRIGTIEEQYGIKLNARRDALLGNLLEERGFDSLSQLLTAYYGRATNHARRRRVFLSFHAEDKQQVSGFRLMINNPRVDLDVFDQGLQEPINSERSPYIKQVLQERIRAVSVVVCLVGNGTAWREWVDWELNTAFKLRKGICGVRLNHSYGRNPIFLKEIGAPISKWDTREIIAAIECSAARRN